NNVARRIRLMTACSAVANSTGGGHRGGRMGSPPVRKERRAWSPMLSPQGKILDRCSRLFPWLESRGGGARRRVRTTRPDQHGPLFIDGEPLAMDEFSLQVLQVGVIQGELALKRSIGQAPSTLEHGNRLVEDLFKGHRPPSLTQACG